MIAREARIRGFNIMLAGGINLARDVRNGRNFEYYSQDRYLSTVLLVIGSGGEVSVNSRSCNIVLVHNPGCDRSGVLGSCGSGEGDLMQRSGASGGLTIHLAPGQRRRWTFTAGAQPAEYTFSVAYVIFKTLLPSTVAYRPPKKIGRALPDRQTQLFDERRVHFGGILGVAQHLFQSPRIADQRSSLDLDDTVVPTRLDKLGVQAR
jgi:hypothetical protein